MVNSSGAPGREQNETQRDSESLEALVAGVAHDLHNLTTAIRTSVETLRNVGESGSSGLREQQLSRIDRAAEQASSLMATLAAFGGREIQLGAAALDTVAADAAQFLRRALRVPIEHTQNRGDSDRNRRVRVDLACLVRALIQLCGNAARQEGSIVLSTTGEREISIELRPGAIGTSPVLPSERDLERARTLLSQIDATLPLSCAEAGGGWTGSVRLSSAPPAREVEPPREGRGAAAPRGRALIAEDHSQVRDALIGALSRCGFAVEAVGDGDAFVERGLAQPGEHDVFLIDFDLPGRDGARALEALREAGISTPALMISGNIDFRSRVEAIANADFMQKPFGLADIRTWATSRLENPTDSPGATSR